VELRVFSSDGGPAEGSFALPGERVQSLRVEGARVVADAFGGRVKWRITR
jgi:hypothetical protein